MRRISSALRHLFFLGYIPATLALCIALNTQPLFAAQSPTQKQSVQKKAAVNKQAGKITPATAAADAQATVSASDVYAQSTYTEKELVRFIESMPHFLAWMRSSKAKVHPVINATGKPDFTYTPEAAAKAGELGWEPRRFFCLLGRTAAALYLVEEGTDRTDALPPDMPTVTDAEMALARKHLAALLRVGTGSPAPSPVR